MAHDVMPIGINVQHQCCCAELASMLARGNSCLARESILEWLQILLEPAPTTDRIGVDRSSHCVGIRLDAALGFVELQATIIPVQSSLISTHRISADERRSVFLKPRTSQQHAATERASSILTDRASFSHSLVAPHATPLAFLCRSCLTSEKSLGIRISMHDASLTYAVTSPNSRLVRKSCRDVRRRFGCGRQTGHAGC